MIYLDNAATTKASRAAVNCMIDYGETAYFNPSAGYAQALAVKKELQNAAAILAGLLGANREEIIFTSCATESNNWAFECGLKNKKGNVVVSAMEHASVYESAMRLKSRGADVRFIPLDKSGHVTEDALLSVIDGNTAFVSIIHCSNETGCVNDIGSLCAAAKAVSPKLVFHADGVQAFCKIPTDVHASGVDLYSVSAHKVGGYKGVGALYVKKGFNMQPYMAGGGQQDGRRSGTENVGGIVGFAAAAAEYKEKARAFAVLGLRERLASKFAGLSGVKINGDGANSGYILSLSFDGLRGEVLANMVEQRGVLIGLGSACSTHVRSNRVLSAMGVADAYAAGSVRLSFSPDTTEEEALDAADIILSAAKELKEKIHG